MEYKIQSTYKKLSAIKKSRPFWFGSNQTNKLFVFGLVLLSVFAFSFSPNRAKASIYCSSNNCSYSELTESILPDLQTKLQNQVNQLNADSNNPIPDNYGIQTQLGNVQQLIRLPSDKPDWVTIANTVAQQADQASQEFANFIKRVGGAGNALKRQAQNSGDSGGVGAIQAVQNSATARGKVADAAADAVDSGHLCRGFWDTFTGNFFVCVATFAMSPLLWIFAKFVFLAGILFSFSVDMSIIQIHKYFDTGSVILVWSTIRDLGNIVFIFFLLWIAIRTILGMESTTQTILVNVLITALLVNFSMFFTKVIIDSSNIVALQFYTAIIGPNCDAHGETAEKFDGCISDKLMRVAHLETIYKNNGDSQATPIKATGLNIIIVGIFGSIFYLITAYVLLQAAFMFLARTVAFVLLAVVSPIAFVLNVVPKTKGYADEWWKAITNQALVAPIFLMFIWIIIKLTEGGGIFSGPAGGSVTNGGGLANAITNGGSMNLVFSFFFLIGLLYFALKITKEFSDKIGATAVDFGSKALGGIAGGAGGFALRNTLGRAAGMASKATANWTPTSGIGKYTKKALQDSSKASWDVRNFDTKTAVSKVAGKTAGATIGKVVGTVTGGAKAVGATVDFGEGYNPAKAAAERIKAEKDKKEYEEREKAARNRDGLEKTTSNADAKAIMDGMTDKEIADLPSNILKKPDVVANLTPSMLSAMVNNLKSGDKSTIARIIRGGGGLPSAISYLRTGTGQRMWP